MLRLKNVRKENGMIKAMYYPEDSPVGKEVSIDEKLNFHGAVVGNGYDSAWHLSHAENALTQMMTGERPIEDTLVMWY